MHLLINIDPWNQFGGVEFYCSRQLHYITLACSAKSQFDVLWTSRKSLWHSKILYPLILRRVYMYIYKLGSEYVLRDVDCIVRVTNAGVPTHILTCQVCELNNGLFWFMLEVCRVQKWNPHPTITLHQLCCGKLYTAFFVNINSTYVILHMDFEIMGHTVLRSILHNTRGKCFWKIFISS